MLDLLITQCTLADGRNRLDIGIRRRPHRRAATRCSRHAPRRKSTPAAIW